MWHEIVTTGVGTLSVAVTYCPLCNSGMVFDRTVGADVPHDVMFAFHAFWPDDEWMLD